MDHTVLPANYTVPAILRCCSRVPQIECDECGELMDNVYKLQIHQLRAHRKGKLFSCHHCSFKSPRKKDVQGLTMTTELVIVINLVVIFAFLLSL